MIAITDRYKFPLYHNRAEFKAAAGFDAPAFNPAWPIKQWFDPAGTGAYVIWNGSLTEPKLAPLSMSAAEAGTVNLPGLPNFPAYALAGTGATKALQFGAFRGAPQAVDPATLSTKAEADALAALVGATVVQSSAINAYWHYEWGSETRRDYILQYKGLSSGPFVGNLLQDMNFKGVGAPGHWSASQIAAGHLQWVAEVMDDGSGAHPVMDIPLALQPDEELYSEVQGLIPFVGIRKIGTPAPVSGGDAFGKDTNDTVHKIAKAMQLE